MICLGIESTAHTFGAAIVTDNGAVLSNAKALFKTEEGGMVPNAVTEFLIQNCDAIIKDALSQAKVSINDVDLISYSGAPGMGHCLRIGAMAARSLSVLLNKPIIGVNHCIAHLEIGRLKTAAKDPVLLYASGANTQIIAYDGGKYRIFGETLDIGVGNFIDAFARELSLGFPGGPAIEKLALQGKNYIELPYVVKGMDVSFGGILTNLKQKIASNQYTKEDLCYSVQETVFAMLLEVSERAMAHCEKSELLLGGGVACNTRLQQMAQKMCEERGAKSFCPEKQYLVDNAAMIAWLGILQHKAGARIKVEHAGINPYERTDDVKVNWR